MGFSLSKPGLMGIFGFRKYTTESIIKAVRQGGRDADRVIDYLYQEHRDSFIRFVQSHNGDQEDALDVFQDALIVLVNNIERGVFKGDSNIKTYLFSIGRRKWYKCFNKKIRLSELNEKFSSLPRVHAEDPWQTTLGDERNVLIGQLMDRLKEKNKQILLLWMEGYNMTEIAKRLGLKNAQVARNYKSRAMKELMSLLEENTLLKSYLYIK